MEKLYCYVDETGQDTKGKLFIVSVTMVKEDRADIINILDKIEKDTGKKTKWSKTPQKQKIAYISRIVQNKHFVGKIFYRQMGGTSSYHKETLTTIALAVEKTEHDVDYKASVYIDGLPRPQWRGSATDLHRLGVITEKVRGVKDEAYVIVRLADAMAGFVREYSEGLSYAQELYHLGVRNKVITSL